MEKTRKIKLIISAIALIVLFVIFGYKNSIISDAKTGYLVYADDTIVIIDLEATTQTEHNVDGYSSFDNIGKYFGGDFCCVATNNETIEQEILLFKNGVVEKSYPIMEDILSVSVYNDVVYYLTKDGNLNYICDDKTELLANNIEEFVLNSLGGMAYIKEIPDEEYSAESSINGELYYYVNEKATKLGEAYRAKWLSDKELLVSTEKVDKEYDSDGALISAGHIPEDYIVNVKNNEWICSKEFNKIPLVACVSPDGKKAVVYYSDEGFTTLFFGIYDIERDICDKNAIYDGINNKDVFDDMGTNIIWFDENPMN